MDVTIRSCVPYTLRPATRDDFAFMRDTKLDGMRPYVEATWGWDRQRQEDLFLQKFDPDRSQIVVMDGADAGYIQLEDHPEEMFLAGIYLTAASRRHGIGEAILRDLITVAAAREKPLTLRVLKVNPARHLYERVGFSVTAETDTHFLMRWS